jgi:hypothetical protein
LAEPRAGALAAAAAVALLLACSREPGPPPYALEAYPTQRFRLEALDETDVDGSPVRVERSAEFRLALEPGGEAGHEIALHLERYWLRVEGAPGGESQLALSEQGLFVQAPSEGSKRLGPSDPVPGGSSVRSVLARPIASFIASGAGDVIGRPWYSQEPLVLDVPVLDWLLLCLPVLADAATPAWSGERALPRLGQYEFGISLPLRYERASAVAPGASRVLASGSLQRDEVRVTDALSGSLELDHQGEADLDARGRVREARVELRFRFASPNGTRVSSRSRVIVRCTDCDGAVNPEPPAADTQSG